MVRIEVRGTRCEVREYSAVENSACKVISYLAPRTSYLENTNLFFACYLFIIYHFPLLPRLDDGQFAKADDRHEDANADAQRAVDIAEEGQQAHAEECLPQAFLPQVLVGLLMLYEQQMLGFSLMKALGIRSDEIVK